MCLSDDDLEALNTLYPDCDGGVTLIPDACHKSSLNIGVVRVFVYLLIPLVCAQVS